MKRTSSILISFMIFVIALTVLTACAPAANIRPPSFANVLEGFEEFGVSIESSEYIGIPNNIYFDLRVTKKNINGEDFIPMLEAISEYLRSEQFIDYFERFSQRMGG